MFSNRSQMTPKCGKNIGDTLGCASCATFLFLPHFDVICDLLLNTRTATWNLFVKYEMTKTCHVSPLYLFIRISVDLKQLLRSFLYQAIMKLSYLDRINNYVVICVPTLLSFCNSFQIKYHHI